jgi:hypothetical protein
MSGGLSREDRACRERLRNTGESQPEFSWVMEEGKAMKDVNRCCKEGDVVIWVES